MNPAFYLFRVIFWIGIEAIDSWGVVVFDECSIWSQMCLCEIFSSRKSFKERSAYLFNFIPGIAERIEDSFRYNPMHCVPRKKIYFWISGCFDQCICKRSVEWSVWHISCRIICYCTED